MSVNNTDRFYRLHDEVGTVVSANIGGPPFLPRVPEHVR